jgi:hypothetical protein
MEDMTEQNDNGARRIRSGDEVGKHRSESSVEPGLLNVLAREDAHGFASAEIA